jgi:hypothetical protein
MKIQHRYTKPLNFLSEFNKETQDAINEGALYAINEVLHSLMTMNMEPGSRDAIVQENLHQWRKDRAEAQALKAERQRSRQVAKQQRDFRRGFNSIGELLPNDFSLKG